MPFRRKTLIVLLLLIKLQINKVNQEEGIIDIKAQIGEIENKNSKKVVFW